jgi:transcriptional regulator with PAS, ATPase and Fis domain
VFEIVTRVAPTEANVFVVGESGTGKELIARAIHERSRRSEAPFVAVNCAALPDQLLESELFGHEKGAFTGAEGQRRGLLESGGGGTFFLDEVSEMSLDLQAKLLRVVQERRIRRAWGARPSADRHPLGIRDQPRSSGRGSRRAAEAGSVFPAERGSDPCAAPAGAAG